MHNALHVHVSCELIATEEEKVVDPASLARRKYLTKSLSGRNFLAKITILCCVQKKQYNDIVSESRKNFF